MIFIFWTPVFTGVTTLYFAINIPQSAIRPALRGVQGSPEPCAVKGAFRIPVSPHH
jgi:hypothetical protein